MNAPGEALELIPCPLCGHHEHRLVFERPDHTHQVGHESFRIVSCASCSFVFVNPRPTVRAIHAYYPHEFYQGGQSPADLLRDKKSTLDARMHLVSGLSVGRVLDVGCQKGEFLERMRQRGWEVVGVEFSSKPPNTFGLPIHYTVLKDAPLDPRSFDLITLWAVLEHVHDPVAVLKEVKRLLKPGGRALVLVPNFDSIPGRFLRHDDVPRHLLMFTRRTFRFAAQAAGLRVTRFVFSNDIFSGSTRGTLNYLWKLLHGERLAEIVAQNREPGRWREFSNTVRGRDSRLMLGIDRLDIRVAPVLDHLMDWLRLGFIMTAELEVSSA
jgi:SAM-dependent methyltransferase